MSERYWIGRSPVIVGWLVIALRLVIIAGIASLWRACVSGRSNRSLSLFRRAVVEN